MVTLQDDTDDGSASHVIPAETNFHETKHSELMESSSRPSFADIFIASKYITGLVLVRK